MCGVESRCMWKYFRDKAQQNGWVGWNSYGVGLGSGYSVYPPPFTV